MFPTAHVLDDFRFDLLLGQVQLEDRFLPGDQQTLHIEPGQFQEIALGCKCTAGDQHMDVWMPVQEFAMSLNRRNHARYHILAPEQALCFRLETPTIAARQCPGARRKFAQ